MQDLSSESSTLRDGQRLRKGLQSSLPALSLTNHPRSAEMLLLITSSGSSWSASHVRLSWCSGYIQYCWNFLLLCCLIVCYFSVIRVYLWLYFATSLRKGPTNSLVLNALGTLVCIVNFWNDVHLVETVIFNLYSRALYWIYVRWVTKNIWLNVGFAYLGNITMKRRFLFFLYFPEVKGSE